MLNFDLVTNLTTIAGLLAGFCITIVIELIIEANLQGWNKKGGEAVEKTGPPEIDWGNIRPQKQNVIQKAISVISDPEKNNPIAIFAFLFSAIFLITASVTGAVISGHENAEFQKLLLYATVTVIVLAVGFLFFFVGTWLLAMRTKSWIAKLISILIFLSLVWIVVVYFCIC